MDVASDYQVKISHAALSAWDTEEKFESAMDLMLGRIRDKVRADWLTKRLTTAEKAEPVPK